MSAYKFDKSEAETVLMGVLAARGAIRSHPDFALDDPAFCDRFNIDHTWVENSQSAYAWTTRSPLAIVLCGLLARATDPAVDPLSLQEQSGEFGYSASGLWQKIIKNASGTVSLRKLKDQPFNNSPFGGKKRLSTDWDNVDPGNEPAITAAFDMLTHVSAMDCASAQRALRSFLIAAPAPSEAVDSGQPVPEDVASRVTITLIEFADRVAEFILLNSDDGRRAQAFVTAAVEVVLPNRSTTAASVNDPSRTDPGDVKSLAADSTVVGPLFVEVKDKVVRRNLVNQFQAAVRAFDRSASAGYAALANVPGAEMRLDEASRIPDSERLTRDSGVPTAVWKSPLELLTQVAVWSALPVPVVIWQCAQNYRHWLDHLDTGKNGSPQEWDRLLLEWGLIDAHDSRAT